MPNFWGIVFYEPKHVVKFSISISVPLTIMWLETEYASSTASPEPSVMYFHDKTRLVIMRNEWNTTGLLMFVGVIEPKLWPEMG